MKIGGIATELPYAEVVLNLAVDLLLTYRVPEELRGKAWVGQKVLVPLGGRRVTGFIINFVSFPSGKQTRSILKILNETPFFNPPLVRLIGWISRYYYCSFPRALKSVLPAAVRKITTTPRIKMVRAVPPEGRGGEKEIITALSARAPRQARLLEILYHAERPREARRLLEEAGAPVSSLNSLQKKGLVAVSSHLRERDSWAGEEILPTTPLLLNEEQLAALKKITGAESKQKFKVFLLHGVTGSGKTEIYLQAVAAVLAAGKDAIVMVPEISLTPQIGERFRARFGDQVSIIHSALPSGERHDQWLRIASGRARIVVGPRSAVFAPVKRLGLIVVDEEHEGAYKQSPQTPCYHGRDVAVMRAKLEGAVAVLGSATPSLESYYNYQQGKYTLLPLRERPLQGVLPRVEVIDMRYEREAARHPISFSLPLLGAIKKTLQEGRQAILFLNRRGFQTLVICRKCGYIARCPHCSISLIYHKDKQRLVCHLCGYTCAPPQRCPLCHSPKIFFQGLGTQRVEEWIKKYFPVARTQRMDTDAVSFQDAPRKILRSFKAGKIDILVGTQMIAKGLDYPNVTLVGVIFADTALNLADFRASEFTFQILTQVTGRAGRGEIKGEVIIQTYSPKHPAIRAAARQDYESFYKKEIAFREELGYPPFNHFINLTVLSRQEKKSRLVAEHIAKRLLVYLGEGSKILGPAPPPLSRIRGRYRWQLTIKTKKVVPALAALDRVLPALGRSRQIKVEVDVDPFSML